MILMILENIFILKFLGKEANLLNFIIHTILLCCVMGAILFLVFIKTRGEQDLINRIKTIIKN